MDDDKPKKAPPGNPGTLPRGVDLGLDKVARREERKLRRARALVEDSADAFEHKPDRSETAVEDEIDRQAGRARKSLQVTGHSTGSEPPVVSQPQGLPLRPADPASVEATLPVPARSLTVPPAESVLQAAHERMQRHGRRYAAAGPWFSPHPKILGNQHPDHRPVPDTTEQFKDVYLCLDVLYLAGYEVPLVPVEGSPGTFWYPTGAELIEQAHGTRRTVHLVGQQKLQGVPHKQRRLRVHKAVREAQTGDLVVGLYRSEDRSPYGMVWLVLENRLAEESGLEALSCDDSGAIIALYPVDHFIYAEHVQVLRPVRALGGDMGIDDLAPPPKLYS
ncbi:MAG: hypothetical protein ABIJ09_14425 [Pseudomonadota bacterium]